MTHNAETETDANRIEAMRLRNRELEQAFNAFNSMSEQLQTSYQELENRVEALSAELAAARSERMRQLQEKERIADRLEKLLDALPGGVVVIDGAGVVIDQNAAAVDLLGEPLKNELWQVVLERAFEPSQEKAHELNLRDGRVVSMSVRSLDAEPGRIILLNDVTETRAMEESIQHHKRLSALGEMAASMAHQIRTPLATALLYVSNLARTDLKPEARQRFSEKILSRLRHMESQVNDMLVYARGGRFGLDDLTIGDLVHQFRLSMEHHVQDGVRLDIDMAEDGVIKGNAEALLGVLSNLANNAMQAQPDDLKLTMTVKQDRETVAIKLRDNGPGMDNETIQRVFDPFFTTRPEGTGLGLAVVQQVVHAHHGRVVVHSQEGQGSTFQLILPRAEQTQASIDDLNMARLPESAALSA